MEISHITELRRTMSLLMAAYRISGDDEYLWDGLRLIIHNYRNKGSLIETLVAMSLES